MNTEFYLQSSYDVSRLITKRYSTSFSIASSLMDTETKQAIYAVYGFVRLADEIVDTFNDYDQELLLNDLEVQLESALKYKISSNVILNSFVDTVYKYNISLEYIYDFLKSMRADLSKSTYTNNDELKDYIYGSADVVGLMCLQIFCKGDNAEFERLAPAAKKLGTAFQKVNFLRDLHCDKECLGRSYFPEITNDEFNLESKRAIEAKIDEEFDEAWI